MRLIAFEKTLSRQEAWKAAELKGSLLWKAVFASQPLKEIRLRYIEYKLIEINMRYKITPLLRMRTNVRNSLKSFLTLSKDGTPMESQSPMLLDKTAAVGEHKIMIISNGTSGSPSLVDALPEIVTMEMEEDQHERLIQDSAFSEDEMITNAKKLAVRVMHRIVGGIPRVSDITVKTVYRPFYVAFYGDVVEGNKVRYITIPADGGHTTKRGEFA